MTVASPRGGSIFRQTFLLVLASVVVVQIVSIALFLSMPLPRPDFNRLSDVAEALAGRPLGWDGHHRQGPPPMMMPPPAARGAGPHRERALAVKLQPAPPVPDADMITNPRFANRLAAQIGVPLANVRLYYHADQRGPLRLARRDRNGDVLIRRGEPIFFDTVIAGLDTGDGWRVVQTPPRPWIADWQRRMLLMFAVSALLLLPVAWLFARRLARPIRRFADAADRMGRDPTAPVISDSDGPAELRVTAAALNRMQQRLTDYVAERTAMIGAIAHDLRTPLARIAFRIEQAPEEVRCKVQADIDQMNMMIAATIGFVRGSTRTAAMQPVMLDQLLRAMVADEQEVGRPVRADAIAPLVVTGDADALRRLFQNLIDNAIVYGHEASIGLAAEDDSVVVRVADKGPGLPEALLTQVLQPFERADPSRNRATGGIGLGLAIARGIAQDHGGTLILQNIAGGGLVAICRFPLQQS